jgi:hypothetical protein
MLLRELNKYDLALWEYAQTLAHTRLQSIPGLVQSAHKQGVLRDNAQCLGAHTASSSFQLPSELHSAIGVKHPPGHKGPIDGFNWSGK